MPDHARGRAILAAAWLARFGTPATTRELQALAAVSLGESPYGQGTFKQLDHATGDTIAEHRGTNNWGAIQCGSRPPCPAECFTATDTHPGLSGATYYDACFRRWPTPELGAIAYLETLLVKHDRAPVKRAVSRGSAHAIASAMHASRYYEGASPIPSRAIATYAASIERHGKNVAAFFGEPYYLSSGSDSGDESLAMLGLLLASFLVTLNGVVRKKG